MAFTSSLDVAALPVTLHAAEAFVELGMLDRTNAEQDNAIDYRDDWDGERMAVVRGVPSEPLTS